MGAYFGAELKAYFSAIGAELKAYFETERAAYLAAVLGELAAYLGPFKSPASRQIDVIFVSSK